MENLKEQIIKVAMLENGEFVITSFSKIKINLSEIPENVITMIDKAIKMNNILGLELQLKGFNLTKKMFDSSYITFKNKKNGLYANITNENHEFPNAVICFEENDTEMIKKLYMSVK